MKSLPVLTTTQLGAVLQGARKGKRMTQAEMAAHLGVGQSRVSHLEQNPGQLSVDQLLDMCVVLGLELTIGERGAGGDAETDADGGW
jgi:HTH-type transcriptional regulator / antitoxin HipB